MEIYDQVLTKDEINKRFHTATNAILMNHLISSKAGFAESLGMTPSKLSEILNGRMNVSAETLARMCDFYGVSPEWLFMSRGNNVFRTTKKPKIWVDDDDLNQQYVEPEEPQVEVKPIHHLRSTEKKEEMQVVYLYDFEASAGLRALFDNNRQNIIDTIKIPNLPKCDGAIHIVGDSMYPLLKSGDIILYRQMPLDINNLLYGEMYLLSYDLDGDDYIVVKYIRKSDKGESYIKLSSENPAHASRDIDFHRVTALALVKASVRINCMI